jgi:para-nitrobenzyl esterase
MHKRWTLSALVIPALAGAAHFATREVHTQGSSCLVTTFNGDVQGVDNGSSCAFLGIPFAAPPLGGLRWRPPQPAAPWAPATLSATGGLPCANVNPPGSTTTAGSEDCLKLNIWTPEPAPASPAPVIAWIHTGAFQSASANLADSNGRKMAEQTGAIVVAANYRTGPFGFLGHSALTAEDPGYRSSGNYGFLDQRAALAWVRDHIAAFGGDPNNVTIAGQSAGANSVSIHVVSPGSAGYFHRAIMQSGYASTRWPTLADAEALGHDFAAAVGCTDPSQVLACMRAKSRAEVLLAFPNGQQEFAQTARIPWGPVVDRLDIPDQPRRLYEDGTFNRVPLIIGATRDEGWIYVDRSFPAGLTTEQYETAVSTEFGAADAPAILAQYPVADFPSPKLALSRLTGDVEMVCEARRVARLVERTRTPVYFYAFEREADAVVPDLVIHGLDRNFVFGNNFGPPSNYVLNADDLSLFGAISGYWTRFAASGNPNGGRRDRRHLSHDRDDDCDGDHGAGHTGDVYWPAFKHPGRGAGKYLVLDVPVREDKRLREEQCDFWEPFFLRSIANGSVPASHPSNELCGVTITEDLKLDHDLTCVGNGFNVGADHVKVDLNGHTITGSGSGAGINVTGRTGVSIFGGTIRNFGAGVLTNTSSGIVIKRNEFVENVDGVDLQAGSSGNTIRHNNFRANRSRGIMIRGVSTNHVIRQNTLTGDRVGILVFAGADNTVEHNLVSASMLAGIRINIFATGNLVTKNTVTSNPAGIEFLVSGAQSAVGNTVARNTIEQNACGLKGPVTGNTVEKNHFKDNVEDSCQ